MASPARSPLTWLNRFASQLGWPRLDRHRHRVRGQLITWYISGVNEDGGDDRFLQINECPIGQQKRYAAAVYALRFRLCSGWSTFRMTAAEPDRVVARLAPCLAAPHFLTESGRHAFRAAHPEAAGYTLAKIRRVGPPYQVVDAKTGRTARCD